MIHTSYLVPLDSKRSTHPLHVPHITMTEDELKQRIQELEQENHRLKKHLFQPGDALTVQVPEPLTPIFKLAQQRVQKAFDEISALPEQGSIEIGGERYILMRASALSQGLQETYESHDTAPSISMWRNQLFDIAYTLGSKDAAHFAAQHSLEDPIEMLSSGPVHFAYTGWAKVHIDAKSSPTPDQNFVLIYDHPYSFEADAWVRSKQISNKPTCIMNAGYSSGWCSTSFGLELTAVEIQCRAQGHDACTFIMAPPSRIRARIQEFFPDASPDISSDIPTYLALQQVSQTLRESEERYRALVEHAPEAILVLDPTKRGRLEDCNEVAQQLFGAPRQKLLTLDIAELSPSHQPDGTPSIDMIEATLEEVMKGHTMSFEWTHKNLQGQEIPCEVRLIRLPYGNHYLIRGSITDISTRTQKDKENRRLATALEQAAETVMITDTRGRILHINPAFERVTGYQLDEVVGKPPTFLKNPMHDDSFYRTIWDTISSGQVWSGRTFNTKKNGEIFEAEGTFSPVRDPGGQIINYVAVNRDISRESELERQLNQSQKMEAIGTLAGGIAHDLNNLLSPILGFAQILEEDIESLDEVRYNAAQISRATRRASALVGQVLAFSHKSESAKQPTLLQTVLDESTPLLQHSLPSVIDLQIKLSPCRHVLMNATQLQQIILNLCTNAKHALQHQPAPHILIELEEVSLADGHLVAPLPPGDYAKLSVKDNGKGMDHSTQSRIFEPYFTTKEVGSGTGLGMATVHKIVTDHQGHIRLESQPGHGTSFEIYLPIVAESTVPHTPQQPHAHTIAGKESILFVDDEEPIVHMVSRGMERLGYQVTGFTSSTEALAHFKQHPDAFDIVISDQTMPGLTGVEMARQIHALRPELPIILCSGHNTLINQHNFTEYDLAAYLSKPLTHLDLATALRTVIDDV